MARWPFCIHTLYDVLIVVSESLALASTFCVVMGVLFFLIVLFTFLMSQLFMLVIAQISVLEVLLGLGEQLVVWSSLSSSVVVLVMMCSSWCSVSSS
jgi:hypothetical protein